MASETSISSEPSRPKTVPSFTVAVALTTAIALAAIAVPILWLRPRENTRPPPPVITVVSGPVDVIPARGPGTRRALVAELRTFVKELYQRAFTSPDGRSSPSPSPASPTYRIDDLFTAPARPSLRAHPEVFDPGPDVRIARGVVRMNGLANIALGGEVGDAFLNVAFDAHGSSKGWPVTLRQTGTLLLVRIPGGWRVSGFDLRLRQAGVTPSPSPGRTRS